MTQDISPDRAAGYAGDISPQQAWAWVQAGQAVLVDVRSDAEREWVGFVPGAVALAWKQWPGMAINPESIAAARRATELGVQAYNILEGFEGDPDPQGHRGRIGGWRMRGLPWRQN
jgi:rhodanese-related sulfurtransferase